MTEFFRVTFPEISGADGAVACPCQAGVLESGAVRDL
jgi:hypothetical protein